MAKSVKTALLDLMSKYGCHMQVFTSAKNGLGGESGAVPAPKPGQEGYFLCSDGEFRPVYSTSDTATRAMIPAQDVDYPVDTVVAFNNAVS